MKTFSGKLIRCKGKERSFTSSSFFHSPVLGLGSNKLKDREQEGEGNKARVLYCPLPGSSQYSSKSQAGALKQDEISQPVLGLEPNFLITVNQD